MNLIWYSPEEDGYKFGKKSDYQTDARQSSDPASCTVLMSVEENSITLAGKIIRQLNRAHTQS